MRADLIIRADGGNLTGMGHLVRCTALGQEWRAAGGRVYFVTATDSTRAIERFEREEFQVTTLSSPYPDPADLECVEAVRMRCEPAAVIVDGYQFDARYQERLRSAGNTVLVIDDNAHLPHYCADFILNPNAYAETLEYSREPGTRLLLGPRYALLRREFSSAPRVARTIPEHASRVLVTMGGSDPQNCTVEVLQMLATIEDPLSIVVVAGEMNPHYADIQTHASGDRRVRLETNPEKMQPLMAWADLAISGAGQTCLELAYTGTPMCVCVIADNQIRAAEFFTGSGVAVELGGAGRLRGESARSLLVELLRDPVRRAEMSRRGMELVDGQGCRTALRELTAARQSGL